MFLSVCRYFQCMNTSLFVFDDTQKRPIYTQKSDMQTQKRPIHEQKNTNLHTNETNSKWNMNSYDTPTQGNFATIPFGYDIFADAHIYRFLLCINRSLPRVNASLLCIDKSRLDVIYSHTHIYIYILIYIEMWYIRTRTHIYIYIYIFIYIYI